MSIEKQKLYNEIETLPEELTNQVINFIEYLKLSYIDMDAPDSVTIKSKKDLKEKLQGNLSSEEWKNIENNTIKQPNDAQTGDQYILWLTAENDNDVHFLTSYRNYDEEIVEKEIKTVLPYTYDNNTLLVVLGIVIIAIIAVSVRIAILKKKEMSK